MFFNRRNILNVGSLYRNVDNSFMNLIRRNKSNGINGITVFIVDTEDWYIIILFCFCFCLVSNYETGFNSSKPPTDPSLIEELDLLGTSFEPPQDADNSVSSSSTSTRPSRNNDSSSSRVSSDRRSPNRAQTSKYPTGGVAKQRCYNCGQVGHVSFDCQQPQVRKACYTCGNSGHLARDW